LAHRRAPGTLSKKVAEKIYRKLRITHDSDATEAQCLNNPICVIAQRIQLTNESVRPRRRIASNFFKTNDGLDVGGCSWDRTNDKLIKSQLLYQLSYAPARREL
jgi:hypothetical protein